jgi:hypothetical protein
MPSEPEEDREVGSENEQNMELELVDATTKRSEDEVVQTVGRQDKDKDADEDGKNTTETGRKEMAPRSEMWQHFIKIKDDQGVLKKGKCKYCSRPIKADPYVNGTTALHRHFNVCKRNPHKNNKDPKQGTLQAIQGEGITTWKYDPEAIRQAFVEMVIEDEMPFVQGEKTGFKKFMKVVVPRWNPPSRRTCTRDTVRTYFQEKAKLKLFLENNCERVSLTTDGWTSQQQDSFMAVTAHFIDNNWQFHRKVISFFKVKGHKGDDIGKNMHRCLLEWGLEKVMCVTVDNASSNDSGVTHLRRQLNNAKTSIAEGKYLHMRCAAHIVNLIVQDGLKEVDISIKRVRAAVRYIKNSTSRLAKFKELAEEEKVDSKAFLNLDICTRWNSTYLMLKAAITYDKVFMRYFDEDPCYTIDLLEQRGGPGYPDEADWENSKKMAEFLCHFFDLTERLSIREHVNSHNYFFEIAEVHLLINNWMNSSDPLRIEMGKRMKDKYDKYWGIWHEPVDLGTVGRTERGKGKGKEKENLNLLIFVAAALDPRYKLSEYTKLAIGEIFSEENGNNVWAAVKDCVFQLFEEYRNTHAPPDGITQDNDPKGPKQSQGGRVKSLLAKKLKLHGAVSGSNKSELEKYLGEDTEPEDSKFDILGWWKVNSSRFPVLAKMARDVLAIPVSTVASEAVFSTTGRILDDFRTSLTPFMVQALICTQDWLRRSTPINIQEDMERLAELETGNHFLFHLLACCIPP